MKALTQRLKSITDLKTLQQCLSSRQDSTIPTLIIPAGTCGRAGGADDLIRIAEQVITEKRLTGKIHMLVTGCHGFCEMEPSVLVVPGRTF